MASKDLQANDRLELMRLIVDAELQSLIDDEIEMVQERLLSYVDKYFLQVVKGYDLYSFY